MQTLSKWVFICMSLLWPTFSHAQRVVPVPALTAYHKSARPAILLAIVALLTANTAPKLY